MHLSVAEVDEKSLHLFARLWAVNYLFRRYTRERLNLEGGQRRAKLLLHGRDAIGYYVWEEPIQWTEKILAPVLDDVYVISAMRRRGGLTLMWNDFAAMYPDCKLCIQNPEKETMLFLKKEKLAESFENDGHIKWRAKGRLAGFVSNGGGERRFNEED